MTEWFLEILWQNDSCKVYDRMALGNLMAADHARNRVGENYFVKTKAAPQPSQAIAQRSLPHVVTSPYKITILYE